MQHPRELTQARPPVLRAPRAEDGAAIWALVRDCKPLDENSMYCNMLQCDHFADTCVLAERNGKPIGWISAYIPPNDPETLFVWQVAVSEKARGLGLGGKMLAEIVARDVCAGATRIQTTITDDNDASWGLFRKFGKRQGTQISAAPHYERATHFLGTQATENLVTIPLAEALASAA